MHKLVCKIGFMLMFAHMVSWLVSSLHSSPGFVNPLPKQATCLSCESGKFNTNNGSTECIRCPKGTHQLESGQSSCKNCSAGYYWSGLGAQSCIECPPGFYTDKDGSNLCTQCEVSATHVPNAQCSTSSSVCL